MNDMGLTRCYKTEVFFTFICLSWQLSLPLENSDSILQFADQKKTLWQKNFFDFLHGAKFSATLTDFCLNLVTMTTLFNPLKITIVLNLSTPQTLQFTPQISQYFVQN